jgi:hypothetical protein
MLEAEGPRYARAAEASAQIVNQYLNSDRPKSEIFGRILFVILAAMYQAEEELGASRFFPSEN